MSSKMYLSVFNGSVIHNEVIGKQICLERQLKGHSMGVGNHATYAKKQT